jgi:hypothetical protein
LAEDYVQHIAQTFLNLGADNPRLNSAYKIDFCLQRTLAAWKLTDPVPLRVKPIPISVIRRIATLATENTGDDTSRAAADMVIIAFFFLLQPGEYTDNETNPFCLTDTQLFIGNTRRTLLTAPAEELRQARFASLTFTSQKNGVQGEVIGLTCLSDPFLCLVKAIIRHVLYLQSHFTPPTTPLACVFNTPDKVTASYLTTCIRDAVAALGPDLGFLPSEVSAQCLQVGGQQPSSLPRSTPTLYASLGIGALTRCYAISMCKPTHS